MFYNLETRFKTFHIGVRAGKLLQFRNFRVTFISRISQTSVCVVLMDNRDSLVARTLNS